MQTRGLQVRGLQLLRTKSLPFMREELADSEEDVASRDMRRLLERHAQAQGLQTQGAHCAGEGLSRATDFKL
jgi:hypothetical protein